MISLKSLTNKKVISLNEAEFLGISSKFYSKNKLKSIQLIEIETNTEDFSAVRFLPFKRICGFGENAITVPHNLCINSLDSVDLNLHKEVILSTPLYNIFGDFLGNLEDIILNENGTVFSLISPKGEFSPLLVKNLSKDMIVLGDSIPQKRIPKTLSYPNENYLVKQLENSSVEPAFTDETFTEIVVSDLSGTQELNSIKSETFSPRFEPQKLIGDYRFLLGREVSAAVYGLRGELVAKKGDVITAAVVERAKFLDRLVDLTENSKS